MLNREIILPSIKCNQHEFHVSLTL